MFLNILIPLLLAGIQWVRTEQAKKEIEQAEQDKIPGESSQIAQTMIERGVGSSSAFKNYVAEPARQYAIARRVREANAILQTPTVNPLAAGVDLISMIQSRLGGNMGNTYGNVLNRRVPPNYYQ